MSLLCVDGVDRVLATRALAPVALGYIDGDYQTYGDLRRGGHYRLVIPLTVTGRTDAIVADCEAGDLSFRAAADWAVTKLKLGHRPCIYGTKSSIDLVVEYLRNRRVRADLVDYWLADWIEVGEVGIPPSVKGRHWPTRVPSPYAGWQFASTIRLAQGACDMSIITERFAVRHGLPR